MEISLVIISTLLVLSVFVPFIIFIYNGTKKANSIKSQSNLLIKNNGIIYSVKEVWRQSFIGLSADNSTITYIHFKQNGPVVRHINLADVKQINIIKIQNNLTNKVTSLKNLDMEFIFKTAKDSNVITFFSMDADLSEDFELQRIEKWHGLIKNAINELQLMKIAS